MSNKISVYHLLLDELLHDNLGNTTQNSLIFFYNLVKNITKNDKLDNNNIKLINNENNQNSNYIYLLKLFNDQSYNLYNTLS